MKVSTITFLVKDDSVYLALKKEGGFGAGYLNGYGGKVGAGETIKQAAVRELEEESGVKTEKIEEIAIIDFFDDQEQVFECHVFFAKEWEGEPKETKEMGPPKLYKLNDMPYEEMWKADRTWLPLVFSGEKIRAEAYYKKGMKEFDRLEPRPLGKEIREDLERNNLTK